MSEQTWSYWGRSVGGWSTSLSIPDDQRHPLAAARYALERLIPILDTMHRPRRLQLSWGEVDEAGESLGFHEDEETPLGGWNDLFAALERVAATARARVIVQALSIDLDTALLDEHGGGRAAEQSAELLLAMGDEAAPATLEIAYYTNIDAWLSTTYGPGFTPRANRAWSRRNQPRLEAFLRGLAAAGDRRLEPEAAQIYYFAISESGFRDVDELPPRRG